MRLIFRFFAVMALVANHAILSVRQLENVDDLKWSIRAGSEMRPAMVALLVYDSVSQNLLQLDQLRQTFAKVSHNQSLRDFVDFLELDIKYLSLDDLARLEVIIDLKLIPGVTLFSNSELIDTCAVKKRKNFRNLVNCVKSGFSDVITQIRRDQHDKDHNIEKPMNYPPYYFGASFGEPFYSSYAGRHFYGGYYYPYSYSIYFNTAFFTQMAV